MQSDKGLNAGLTMAYCFKIVTGRQVLTFTRLL